MVLKCEIGTGGRKPQVEEYGLDELAASAESGLGPLVAVLARLAGEAGGAVTLDAMEVLVSEQGRGTAAWCAAAQPGWAGRAGREIPLARVAGADGVARSRVERGHARPVVTRLGEVVVRRIGYRAGVKGVPSLFARDAVLNLPPLGYSWQLQRLAQMFSRSGSCQQAREFVLAATGVSIGKRQLEQITAQAAADAERFCQDRPPGQEPPAGTGDGEQECLPPLAISADGKGVAMRPEARRSTAKAPGQRARTFQNRRGTGEKTGRKRMAETGRVSGVSVPDRPARTPGQVMHPGPGSSKTAPRAVNRWYTTDITAGRDVTIGKVFGEADRRDPGHRRTWIALAGGDIYQIGLIQAQAQAAARGVTLTILAGFIHVL